MSETDVGGDLTIDHFQPHSRGGADAVDNLVYCCAHCNQLKGDYWPTDSSSNRLWNPRLESSSQHFLNLANGMLYPLTSVAAFTVNRLRLNRPALISFRYRRHQFHEAAQVSNRNSEIIALYESLLRKHMELLLEQNSLLNA